MDNMFFKIGKLIFYPYLINKDTLAFTNSIIGNDGIVLNESKKGIDIDINNKHYVFKLSDEEYIRALRYKKLEQLNSKKFFNSLKMGRTKIQVFLLKDGEYWIRSNEAWDRGFAPYWDRMFRYIVKENTSYMDNDKEDEFQLFLNNRFSFGFNPSKYNQVIQGNDRYIEINLNDFIDIIK